MTPVLPQVIQLLRKMAGEGCSVTDMVSVILREYPPARPSSLELTRSFRDAFGLTLAQAKPIADYVAYGEVEPAESNLHALVWDYIEANRALWDVHYQKVN